MRRTLILAALMLAPVAARADVIVRVPFVYVEVGPAVIVRAPFVNIFVPRSKPVPVVPVAPPMPKPAVDDGPPPVPEADRVEAPPPVLPRKAATPGEFVGGAKPFVPGRYDVMLTHPATGKPVRVKFELPVRPRRVAVTADRIEFRWGLVRGLTIRFLPDGGVEVG